MGCLIGIQEFTGCLGESAMDEQSDVALMLRVSDGDEAAFRVLHDRYQHRVLGFFWGLTRDGHAANELTQETFLRIWRVRLRYAATGSFPAYLFAIARMIVLERRRDMARLGRLGASSGLECIADLADAQDAGPRAHAVSSEIGAAIFRGLESLPEEQRMAFLLHTVQGLSMEDVAAAMDCPLNTARSRRLLAVRKLRQILAPVFASFTGRAVVE